jgi:hypothetical protein
MVAIFAAILLSLPQNGGHPVAGNLVLLGMGAFALVLSVVTGANRWRARNPPWRGEDDKVLALTLTGWVMGASAVVHLVVNLITA